MSLDYRKLLYMLVISSSLLPTSDAARSREVIQLYYGADESERGLPRCESPAQACSVLLQRYWRPAALVRLCRCQRRHLCPDTIQRDNNTMMLNNRSHFKFCEPIDNLPSCKSTYIGMSVSMSQPNYSPDEFVSLHHQNIIVSPPKFSAYCQCPEPYYWSVHSANTTSGVYPTMHLYKCAPLGRGESGEFCGNVRYDLDSLYQSHSCPVNHMCVHSGGLEYENITEIFYNGRGRKAHCERLDDGENNLSEFDNDE